MTKAEIVTDIAQKTGIEKVAIQGTVEEFAIHKVHRYATYIIDLEKGNVIWVGKGRAKADL